MLVLVSFLMAIFLAVRSKRLFFASIVRLSPEDNLEDWITVLFPEIIFKSLPEVIVEEMLVILVLSTFPLSFARSDLSR